VTVWVVLNVIEHDKLAEPLTYLRRGKWNAYGHFKFISLNLRPAAGAPKRGSEA
jgi:hypothetical protein